MADDVLLSPTIKPRIVERQSRYSAEARLATAKNIISRKIRNSRLIFSRYRQARQRAEYEIISHELTAIQNKLSRYEIEAINSASIQNFFLIEARSAKAYWRGFRLCSNRGNNWVRNPESKDGLNHLLNVGYHLLLLQSEKSLLSAGLYPGIGILHGHSGPEPLVYDFMEIFRQVSVDSVLLPILSRKSAESELNEKDEGRFLGKMKRRWDKKFWYKGKCVSLRIIMQRESVLLRKAILNNRPWMPYLHRWGHSTDC